MDVIKKVLSEELGIEKDKIKLEVPPEGHGDYAFPCFLLSKELKKDPSSIAKDLEARLKDKLPRKIEKVVAEGPYLNFFMNKDYMIEVIAKSSLKPFEKKGTALVEHTSVNPNAPQHVGRARNSIIGDSIVRILKEYGYDVETHYFVNDVGKQIAMLVYGLGDRDPNSISFEDYLKLYIDVNKRLEANPELEKEIFKLIKKYEEGDEETVKKFKGVVDVCLKGQLELLDKLGIKFDKFDYESDFISKVEDVLKRLPTKIDNEGRVVVDLSKYKLPMKDPHLVLKRSDGTYLYIVKDLVYTMYKMDLGKDLNIVVLGEDHKLYFMQLKALLDMLGYKAPDVIHYSFVLLPHGKMSTRKGNVVLLKDFMEEAYKRAKEELEKRYGSVPEKLVEEIAYGAIKYTILKVAPEKNVIFKWEEALDFTGNSSPYLQYAGVRARRILEQKGLKGNEDINLSLLKNLNDEEYSLLKKALCYKDVIKEAAQKYKPNIIANYCVDLAKHFNEFYEKCKVIGSEVEEKRVQIVLIFYKALSKCLHLLGITIPEKM